MSHSPLVLSTGRLSVLYERGALRNIMFNGTEVLRHIYFAVRDRDWRTIPPFIPEEAISITANGFEVRLQAEHTGGGVVFKWFGVIRGSALGVEFVAEGSAQASFLKNRIGLCVLHPGRACAGLPVVITHADGSSEQSVFPRFVSPHQPLLDVRSITHEPAPGLRTTVTFEGEEFETEDQRNWTDGSFKTYSTPLRYPFPAEVHAGWEVHHTVRVTVEPSVVVTAHSTDRFRLPELGTCVSEGAADLQSLGLRYVRVNVDVGQEDRIAGAARFGLPLEIAIYAEQLSALESIRDAALSAGVGVARWIVYKLPVSSVREILPGPVGSGSDANFAELNRNRSLVDGADFSTFSANPQVHGTDEHTIVECLEGQRDAVLCALQFSRQVVVSPLSLLPRFNAVATSGSGDPGAPPSDPRQSSPFIACWTLGSIASLGAAGASAITLFEAAGPRGIAGTPTAQMLSDIALFAPEYAFRCDVSAEADVAALGLGKQEARCMVLASLRPEPVMVTWVHEGRTGRIRLEPYAIQWTGS